MSETSQTERVPDEELDQMIWKLERDGGMMPKLLSLMRELREVRRAAAKPVAWECSFTQIGNESNHFGATYFEQNEKDKWVNLHESAGFRVRVTPLYTVPSAPVVDADLLHAAASVIEDLLTTKDRVGAHTWYDMPIKLRKAAQDSLNAGKLNLPVRETERTHPNSFTDAELEMMAHGDNPQANAYRELLAFRRNSPEIPDGWAMVPIDPTESMVIAGFESEPDEFFSEEDDWSAYEAMSGCQQAAHRAKLCYAAMLAAAPKEVR